MSIASNMRIILLLLPCKLRYFTCHMRKIEYRYSLFLIFIYSLKTGLIGSEISSGISSTSKKKKLKLLDFLLLALYSAVIFAAYVYDLHIIDFIAVRIDVVCFLA